MGNMTESKHLNSISWINTVLLGLVILVAGLMKLFVMKPAAVTQMLSSIGFPVASFFAWVLILSEIVFGIAVLARWQLKYTTLVPTFILFVASLTVYWPGTTANIGNFLIHLALASNYLYVGQRYGK
jgi:uncharacterized membrane protein YphA (DoxX/SURF4 family)